MLLGVLVVLALGIMPAFAYAGVWNLADDFLVRGDSSGPVIKDADGTNVWYLKYSNAATNPASFVPLTTWVTSYPWLVLPVPPGVKGWTVGAEGVPHISVNGTGVDLTSSTSPVFSWPAGTVFTHPGPAGGSTAFSVIEWKSPVTGDATVAVVLKDADRAVSGTGIDYWILKNDTVLASDSVAEGDTVPVNVSSVPVAPGDSLYLVVGPGALHYWDSTHVVDFSVSVPEPPVVSTPASSAWSLALLAGVGIFAGAAVHKRRA